MKTPVLHAVSWAALLLTAAAAPIVRSPAPLPLRKSFTFPMDLDGLGLLERPPRRPSTDTAGATVPELAEASTMGSSLETRLDPPHLHRPAAQSLGSSVDDLDSTADGMLLLDAAYDDKDTDSIRSMSSISSLGSTSSRARITSMSDSNLSIETTRHMNHQHPSDSPSPPTLQSGRADEHNEHHHYYDHHFDQDDDDDSIGSGYGHPTTLKDGSVYPANIPGTSSQDAYTYTPGDDILTPLTRFDSSGTPRGGAIQRVRSDDTLFSLESNGELHPTDEDPTEAFERARYAMERERPYNHAIYRKPTRHELNMLYGFKMQALHGNVQTPRPSVLSSLNPFASSQLARWEAWRWNKDLPRDYAARLYVITVNTLKHHH
ncbi:MAG: hypothetical protein SGCHY_005168 [Lobulomycetales sp.]